MSIQHHPDPSSLMAYAAGTLGEALSAVVAAHAERCPACRHHVNRLAALGGAILEDPKPGQNPGEAPSQNPGETAGKPGADGAMADGALAAVLARLDDAGVAPSTKQPTLPVLERLLGGPLSEARWKRVAPGVKMIRLPVSAAASGELKLLHIGAGRAMPDHGHGGAEMTLVLEGAYADKFGRFGPGDVADLDVDVDHEPTVEMGADCICLIASEHRARFKSGFMRMLQPWFRV